MKTTNTTWDLYQKLLYEVTNIMANKYNDEPRFRCGHTEACSAILDKIREMRDEIVEAEELHYAQEEAKDEAFQLCYA